MCRIFQQTFDHVSKQPNRPGSISAFGPAAGRPRSTRSSAANGSFLAKTPQCPPFFQPVAMLPLNLDSHLDRLFLIDSITAAVDVGSMPDARGRHLRVVTEDTQGAWQPRSSKGTSAVGSMPSVPDHEDVDVRLLEAQTLSASVERTPGERASCAHRQPVISGMSSPYRQIYCLWSMSLSRIACLA
jgi:hypothetical protein